MIKERVKAADHHKNVPDPEQSHQLTRQYHNLQRQSDTLKKQLDEVSMSTSLISFMHAYAYVEHAQCHTCTLPYYTIECPS